MSALRITILTDNGLPERSARVSSKTWQTVKSRKANAFFPAGDAVLVATNPFDPDYLLFVVDEGIPEDTFVVSADVKKNIYPSTTYLEV